MAPLHTAEAHSEVAAKLARNAVVNALAIEWKWTQRQVEALVEPAQFLMYGGAKGGGKTVFLCRWAVLQCALYPGNKVFLGRKRFVDFKTTTLETFKRVVDPKLYHHNKNEKRLYLPWCNGIIEYGGLDNQQDIDKFNSYECGAIGVDQAEEITRDHLASLVGSLRLKLPDGSEPSYQIRLTANPAECFLKYDFIENPAKGETDGKGRYVFKQALHTDNPFLPKDYVPNLRKIWAHRPQLLAAYLDGSWDNLSAIGILIQPSNVSSAKMRIFTGLARRRILTADIARQGDDETAIYILELSWDGKIRIIYKEFQGYTENVIDLADKLIALRKKFGANLSVVDAVGIGSGVFDYMRRKKDGQKSEPVFGYIAGSKKLVPEHLQGRYPNLKAMAWHKGAEDFRSEMICLGVDDEELGQQLLWQKSVNIQEIMERVLTRKELKEKYNTSPDRAEAFIMGLHGLRIAPDLPDLRPVSKSEEFWDLVKQDIKKSQNGGSSDGWQKVT